MNILFVLYGDFGSNSANPLALYAREFHLSGHSCVITVPRGLETVSLHENPAFRPMLYDTVLGEAKSIFPDGRPADVIHACTPREAVRRFVTSYMAKRPTPLVILLEDNERWLSTKSLRLDEASLVQHTQKQIADRLPDALSHPFYYASFVGLADAVALIQDKLKREVPPWVYCETVMIGVDIELFSPRPADPSLRAQYGVGKNEKVIVYHGGMNEYTRPGLETLCNAVGLINQKGYPCRLLRSGPMPLDFLGQMPRKTASAINDLGVLPRKQLPELLALADVFVQPGQNDPFEDLRLPGKVPECLAMGRPVIMPDTNIAHLFRDDLDAIILRNGTAEEIAAKCIRLFCDPQHASAIGRAGRLLAEKYFDVRSQARRLEAVYNTACVKFDAAIASKVWCANGKKVSVASRLANRLRSLADADTTKFSFGAAEMLRQHADYIESMQSRVEGLERTIHDERSDPLNHAVAERDRRIASLSQTVAERDGQIASILSSTSWRITSPLRFTKRQITRLLRASGART
jgi:glycosyltransferase involved in cell wall biosynthesis